MGEVILFSVFAKNSLHSRATEIIFGGKCGQKKPSKWRSYCFTVTKRHDLEEVLSIETIAKKGYKLKLTSPTLINNSYKYLAKVTLVALLISLLILRFITEEDVILIVDNAVVE